MNVATELPDPDDDFEYEEVVSERTVDCAPFPLSVPLAPSPLDWDGDFEDEEVIERTVDVSPDETDEQPEG